MVRQYIDIARGKWHIYVYYGVNYNDIPEVYDFLVELDCPQDIIDRSVAVLGNKKNTGLTFTNSDYKTSLICISDATSQEQFVNTAIHEAKHVQSHICEYYNVDESSEDAAYLIGHIVQRMYKMLQRLV